MTINRSPTMVHILPYSVFSSLVFKLQLKIWGNVQYLDVAYVQNYRYYTVFRILIFNFINADDPKVWSWCFFRTFSKFTFISSSFQFPKKHTASICHSHSTLASSGQLFWVFYATIIQISWNLSNLKKKTFCDCILQTIQSHRNL